VFCHVGCRLAKKYHPDVSNDPSARQKFHRISAAYDVLSDPDRRRRYDLTGQHGNEQHFREDYTNQTGPDDFAEQIFQRVWQDLGLREYVDTVRSEAATAWEAARHGDYSFAWDFAKERKGLIASVILPFALMLRFPGALSYATRLLTLFVVVFISNIPPRIAWAIMRDAWIRLTKR